MSKSKADDRQIGLMFAAVSGGNLDLVKKLLAQGVDPNVRDHLNMTLLMHAAQKGRERIFFTLVRAGADLHATGDYSNSVLLQAVSGKSKVRLRMVKAILAAGALRPEEDLPTVFEYACRHGSAEIVHALLAVGVDVNHRYLPLLSAVQENRPEIVTELLKAGARTNVRATREEFGDNKHKHYKMTPIEIAVYENFDEIVTLLKQAGDRLPTKPRRPAEPAPITDSWRRIARWLKANAPGFKPLKKGVTRHHLVYAGFEIDMAWPFPFRESYMACNGDDSGQIFPCKDDISFYLMSLNSVAQDWRMMKELVESGEFKNSDRRVKNDNAIRKCWWNPAWIPFAGNGGGDYFCLDRDPARGGTRLQVIHFRHDDERRTLLAPSLQAFLYELANRLEDGKYRYDEEEGIV